MSVTDLRDMFEDLAGPPAPPTRMTAEATFAEGRRRWRRRRAMTVTTATMVAALSAAGIGVAVAGRPSDTRPLPPAASASTHPPARAGVMQWAVAADARHLYLSYYACPLGRCDKTKVRIVGSDDGGVTWTERNPYVETAGGITVLGPEVLLLPRLLPSPPMLSRDGGRTWHKLTATAQPARAVSRLGGPVCLTEGYTPTCTLYAVDPAAGTFSRLANQPDLNIDVQREPVVVAGGAVWVAGRDAEGRSPAVSVSRDDGQSWSTHVLADGGALPDNSRTTTDVSTVDGHSAFVVANDDAGNQLLVFRGTADGGWVRVPGAEKVPYSKLGGPTSFVLLDGTHVIKQTVSDRPDRSRDRYWAADGDTYRPTEPDGLPDLVYPIRRALDGWYYTQSYNNGRGGLYGSIDGRHWTRVTTP
jgi:hypothetical protein